MPPDFDALGRACLRSRAAYADFARAVELLRPRPVPAPGVHPSAVVAPDAALGPGVSVGAYAVIGAGARLGARVRIHPHVTVYPGVEIGDDAEVHSGASLREGTRLGKRVVVNNGAVIGAPGFGFATGADGKRVRVPHACPVELGDDCEIGANTTIDASHPAHPRRGHADVRTRLGRRREGRQPGAHRARLRDRRAQHGVRAVGLAGSTIVGKHVYLAGRSASAGHLTIGDGAMVGAQTAAAGDVAPGAQVLGIPAIDRRLWAQGRRRVEAAARPVPPGAPDREEARARAQRGVAVELGIKRVGLAELRKRFAESGALAPSRLVRALRADPRAGAQKLAEELAQRAARRGEELRRIARLWRLERELAAQGYACIAGSDEVGMGPLAGPVVAAAVVLPLGMRLVGLRRLQEAHRRGARAARGRDTQLCVGGRARRRRARRDRPAQHLLGRAGGDRARGGRARAQPRRGRRRRPAGAGAHSVTRSRWSAATRASASIAAASIVAKVHRDGLMRELDGAHPGYGFARHMGYSTPEHFAALARLGPSPIHRRSFAPVRARDRAD